MNENNVKQILEMQEENYTNRIGTTFGIFRIDDVKYNWQAHTQEWVITCTKCGHSETVTKSVGWDWLRGKGRSRDKCKNCRKLELESKKSEKIKKEHELQAKLDSIVGQEINGWLVTARNGKKYDCVCNVCGKSKKLSYADLVENCIKCSMCDKNDFSDPDFIGKRYGNLTVLKYIGGQFLTKCDCGFEKQVKCSSIVNGRTTTCGRHICEYHKKAMNYYGKHGELVREVGEETENEIYEYLVNLGYSVERTPVSGDYGVDLICIGRKGERVAIQIKNNKTTRSKTDVHAVQEVFSGGHYYDCDKFAVVSYTGYTDNARKMADKLGVMLCNEKCELYNANQRFHGNIKNYWVVNGIVEAMVDTFRREGWDDDTSRYVNMTYEQVKEYYKDKSERKNQLKIIAEKGLSVSMVEYRMKHMGMTFEQAVNEPKRTMGRPRKQGESA